MKFAKWFFISVLVLLFSVFLHECGHGIANSFAGIPCSTGFNRVGDIDKSPLDDDFRAFYSTAEPVLIDFGVPCTLVLSVLGAFIYAKSKKAKLQYFGASLAVSNSLLRLIPCLMVLLTTLLTGKVHIEDEYETGQLLVTKLGSEFWLYIPSILSVAVTGFSLFWVCKKAFARKVKKLWLYGLVSFFSFGSGMMIASTLDKYLRINWPVG